MREKNRKPEILIKGCKILEMYNKKNTEMLRAFLKGLVFGFVFRVYSERSRKEVVIVEGEQCCEAEKVPANG